MSDKPHRDSAAGRVARILIQDLQGHDMEVILSASADDGQAVIDSDPRLLAVILDWDMKSNSGHRHAADLLIDLREQRRASRVSAGGAQRCCARAG